MPRTSSPLSDHHHEIGKVSFDGATGKVEFDEFGDTTNKTMTAYKVKDGKWVAVKTGSLGDESADGATQSRTPATAVEPSRGAGTVVCPP